jgi:hypothetical protein
MQLLKKPLNLGLCLIIVGVIFGYWKQGDELLEERDGNNVRWSHPNAENVLEQFDC